MKVNLPMASFVYCHDLWALYEDTGDRKHLEVLCLELELCSEVYGGDFNRTLGMQGMRTELVVITPDAGDHAQR